MKNNDMKNSDIKKQGKQFLFTFVGNRDPYVENSDEYGPILSLLDKREFQRVYLFCTGSEYIERARSVEEIKKEADPDVVFKYITLDLASPVDYQEIYSKLRASVDRIIESVRHEKPEISILLDPGTPQMQTVWFLLVRGGYLNAKLLQGVPPRFAGGAYMVREIVLNENIMPEIRVSFEEKGDEVRSWFVSETERKIVGESQVFKDVLEKANNFAKYDISILLQGETGSGKGLLARLIHEKSRRASNPFVIVDCAAVSENLIESELFGHKKGAFTGADSERLGKFRAAAGGTIFLDEIGELPLSLQPKLLRVLEEKKFHPLGSDKEVAVDVRIIAATNRDLEKLVEEEKFRRDLFERLNQVTLAIPPLRDRKEDIPLLIEAFVDEWNKKYGESKGLAEETINYLVEYPWPGNVRELYNVVTALCASGQSSKIGPELLPQRILSYFQEPKGISSLKVEIPDDGVNLKALLYQIEKDFYEAALKKADGNKEKAAKLLGLNPPAFRKALRERFDIGA